MVSVRRTNIEQQALIDCILKCWQSGMPSSKVLKEAGISRSLYFTYKRKIKHLPKDFISEYTGYEHDIINGQDIPWACEDVQQHAIKTKVQLLNSMGWSKSRIAKEFGIANETATAHIENKDKSYNSMSYIVVKTTANLMAEQNYSNTGFKSFKLPPNEYAIMPMEGESCLLYPWYTFPDLTTEYRLPMKRLASNHELIDLFPVIYNDDGRF